MLTCFICKSKYRRMLKTLYFKFGISLSLLVSWVLGSWSVCTSDLLRQNEVNTGQTEGTILIGFHEFLRNSDY